MSGEASKTISNATLWGGGRSPLSVSYGKIMIFLVSDALTFTGLLSAYGYARHSLDPGMTGPLANTCSAPSPGSAATTR